MNSARRNIIIFGVLFAALTCGLWAATPAPIRLQYDRPMPADVLSFRNVAKDTAITASWKLVTYGTFTQMPRPDTLSIRSSDNGDSSWARLYFVMADTTLSSRLMRVSGQDTVRGGPVATYFEKVVADSGSVGTVTVYSKTGGALAIIVPGQEQTYGAFHFFGKGGGGLANWGCAIDSSTTPFTNVGVRFQLRLYNHHFDAINTPEMGYTVVDERVLPYNITGVRHLDIPLTMMDRAIFVPPASYAAIYAASTSGTVTAARVSAYLSGYDKLQIQR